MNKIKIVISDKQIDKIVEEFISEYSILVSSNSVNTNEDVLLITDREDIEISANFKSSSILICNLSHLISKNKIKKFNNIVQIYKDDDIGKISIYPALKDIIIKENNPDFHTYYFSCHSLISNIDYIAKQISDICEYFKIDQQTKFYVNIVLRELMLNAIEHGNQENADKIVEIIFSLHLLDKICILSIKDEGKGFDWKNLSKMIGNEDILRNRHRGIFIVENLADKIEIKKNKISVQLRFKETE